MKSKIAAIIILASVLAAGNLWAGPKGGVVKLKRLNVQEAYTPKVLGLFVGIQEYEDIFWNDLKYPKKDVEDMVKFFTNNSTLELDYSMVITGPEETTRDNLFNNKFDEFEMKNSSEEDVVIVYISSHGTLTKELVTVIKEGKKKKEPRKIPYILTSDTRAGKVADSALSLHKVIDWFEKLRSQRKVLILDMCHSGLDGKSQLSSEQRDLIQSAKGINYIPMEDSRASIILSACSMGSTSFEDNKLKNSVYTHFLLEGMKLGDLNKDGAISISEAHNYSIDKTRRYTWERKQYKQVPATYSKILGKDPIIVSGAPDVAGNPTLFSYASANQGVEIYLDGVHKGMLPKGMVVNLGGHKIECKLDGQKVFSEKLEFKPGYDYQLPYFKTPDDKGYKSFLICEGGYRSFLRDDVKEKLLPDGPTAGFSYYLYGIKAHWFGLSGGFDIAGHGDLEQYSLRLGAKLTTTLGKSRLFFGPDFMFMFFSYASDTIGGKKIDQDMSFFCPGVEALLTFELKKHLLLSFGVRDYYLPYELGSETHNVTAGQIFLTAGYFF